jgi:hypothetical protein
MYMGLTMGMENPMHGKSFDPLHDLGAPLIHFDFTKVARTYRFPLKNIAQRTNDAIASSGAITNNQIRIKTGDAFSTTTFPDAGVILIDNEYFSFSGYSATGSDITTLDNVTRNIAGSIDEHSAFSNINLVAGEYQLVHGTGTQGSGEGLRDFSDWTTDELQLKNEGSAGGYIEIPSDPLARPEGYNATSLGQLHRSCLTFDGSNDRMPLNSAITTTNGNFTLVFVHRPGDSPSSDCIIAGSSGGINQIKINANTLLFRFNSSGSSNVFNQIRANNTTAYSVGSRGTPVDKGGLSNSFLNDQSEFLALVKEKNTTDKKEKVYLYDVQDLIGEDLLNSSGTGGQSGYPDNSENPTNTGLQIQHIGAFANDASDYTGEVAVITVYDRALSTAEIALLQEHYDNLYPSLHHE